jgi:hypothetical protein
VLYHPGSTVSRSPVLLGLETARPLGVSVTARHYVKWASGESDREPMELGAPEAPADLLARLNESHRSPSTAKMASPIVIR